MYKFVKLFLLFCILGILNVLQESAAFADAITGMVGVGTWNTQADFADVKVVQGNHTLYQSHFADGIAEWKTLHGLWNTTADGVLHQTGTDTPSLALVGDPTWSNYTLTLKARKNSGAEGFLITFGSPGDAAATWWNIGGWGNTLHAIQAPGFWLPSIGGSVQTGVWYDIRIQVQGTDIRCYLNNSLLFDTARVLDYTERQSRFQDLLSSSGFNLINFAEQQWLRDLAGRAVYVGDAARATFAAMPSSLTFDALPAPQQAAIIRKVNRNRLTWNTGWGFGSDAWRDEAIIYSMDNAVLLHNQLGLYDAHAIADNSPDTPTADASFNGEIRFGGSINTRVALHELSHFLGTGTFWNWSQIMQWGRWTGFYANTQLSEFDGPNSVLNGDYQHYWPYGENYDNESSPVNDYRHVLMVHALRRDMGIATLDVVGSTDLANGTYVLAPRHAPHSALDVPDTGAALGAPIDIHAYTGGDNQKFLLDLQDDGSYRIRTALPGNRCVDLPYGNPVNGNKLWLWDDNSNNAQRWYIIPTGDGWYRIAPKNDVYKGMDVNGGPWAAGDGTLVQSWDYLDGLNQQWKLILIPTITALSPDHAVAGGGSVTLTFTGTGFLPTSQVTWNGTTPLATTYISSSKLTAIVPAGLTASPTIAALTIVNPDGGLSAPLPFTVTAAPRLVLASAVATRLSNGLVGIAFRIVNQGGAASAVTLTSARLSGVASITPPALGPTNLPTGGTLAGIVLFPANTPAGKRTLQLYGATSAASYSLMHSIAIH